MKRIMAAILILCLLFSLTACRRRVTEDAQKVIYETVPEPVTTEEPTEETTEEPTEETTEEPTEESTTEELTEEPTEKTEPPAVSPVPPATGPAPTAQPGTPEGTGPVLPPEPTETTAPTEEPTEPPAEMTVTLNPNRGICEKESITVTEGQPYGELPGAQREGYHFLGWFDRKNGGNPVTAETIVTAREDHTLYAHWAARPAFTVTFDAQGGRLAGGEASRTVCTGDPYGALPVPVYRGWDFLGWFTAEEKQVKAEDIFEAGEDQTLFARWEYNAWEYWSFFLENTTQKIYACQQVSVYAEFEDHVTASWCSLISRTGSFNVAQNREDPNVTDEWVLEKDPDVLVKFTGDMGNAAGIYEAMAARFPGRRILVVPSAALYGSDAQQLYFAICFGKLLYPDWYREAEPEKVGAELQVSGSIYGG